MGELQGERYRGTEALFEHAANLGELGPAIFVTRSGSSALIGDPGATLRGKLVGIPVRLFTALAAI